MRLRALRAACRRHALRAEVASRAELRLAQRTSKQMGRQCAYGVLLVLPARSRFGPTITGQPNVPGSTRHAASTAGGRSLRLASRSGRTALRSDGWNPAD